VPVNSSVWTTDNRPVDAGLSVDLDRLRIRSSPDKGMSTVQSL
jgi:hypothetical protein